MTLLVIWLFVETQKAVNRERQARLDGKVTHTLRRERCTYAIISIFFALSYIGRFILNVYDSCAGQGIGSKFVQDITYVTVYLVEGASMGVLMLFHCKNFSQGSLFKSHGEEVAPYASIMPGEYHFFPDEEVDAHSLADRSSYGIEDSGKAESEVDFYDSNADTQQLLPVLNPSVFSQDGESADTQKVTALSR